MIWNRHPYDIGDHVWLRLADEEGPVRGTVRSIGWEGGRPCVLVSQDSSERSQRMHKLNAGPRIGPISVVERLGELAADLG